MAKENKADSVVTSVKTTKEEVQRYLEGNKIPLHTFNDGDIFKLTRDIDVEALNENQVKLTNLSDIYWWLIDLRDKVKKSA
jgi:hypothetical protein